jgi:hypothetical protein
LAKAGTLYFYLYIYIFKASEQLFYASKTNALLNTAMSKNCHFPGNSKKHQIYFLSNITTFSGHDEKDLHAAQHSL